MSQSQPSPFRPPPPGASRPSPQREGRPLMLRVAVEGGGCSGFQYQFDLVDAAEADDLKVERDGAAALVDVVSLALLEGLGDRFRRRAGRRRVPGEQPQRQVQLRLRRQLLDLTPDRRGAPHVFDRLLRRQRRGVLRPHQRARLEADRARFLAYVPAAGAILDAGCGSGRDALAMSSAPAMRSPPSTDRPRWRALPAGTLACPSATDLRADGLGPGVRRGLGLRQPAAPEAAPSCRAPFSASSAP